MASRRNKIEIIVEAKDRATANLNTISSGLQRLDQFAGIAGKGFLAFAGAQAAGDIARTVFELGRASEESKRVEASFNTLAASIGESSSSIVQSLREASRGTIDDTSLMLNANRAIILEVAKSQNDLTSLLDVARVRGQALGLSTAQAFNDIVTGVGRLSPAILDNLGIVVDAERTYQVYAQSIGKSADELTNAEKKQALINRIITESKSLLDAQAGAIDENADAFARLTVSSENFQDTFGRVFSSEIAGNVDDISSSINNLTDTILSLQGASSSLGELFDLDSIVGERAANFARNIDVIPNPIESVRRISESIANASESADRFLTRFKTGVAGADREVVVLKDRLNTLVESRDRLLSEKAEASPFFDQSALDHVEESINSTRDALKAAEVAAAQANAKFVLAAGGLGQMSGGTDELRDSLAPLSDKIEDAGLSAEFLDQRARLAGDGMSYMADLALAAGQNVDTFSVRVSSALANVQSEFALINRLTQTTGRAVANAAGGVVDIIGKEGALNLAQKQLAILEDQTQELRRQGVTGLDLQLSMRELENELTGPFDQIRKNQQATRDWADTVHSQASSAFDQLKSKISGVLSGAIGPVAGVDANDLLPRQDAINEDARRLADVAVNGFASPWGEYLNNKFPQLFKGAFESGGDLKTAAALALRDFQDGLNTQLLDKEKAKERVRRMLLGDQRLSDLAGEIAQELSSEFGNLGIGDIATAARAALGVGSSEDEGAGVGASFATGAVSAVSESSPGTQMINLLKAELKAESNINTVKEAGRLLGSAWGQGFLDTVGENVPQRLIDILVNLVVPGVNQALTDQQSLTAAGS